MNAVSQNAPCPCGSGKKFKRCCGVKGKTAAAMAGLSEQARQRYMAGDWQGAAALCDKALEQDANDALALDLMAAILLQHNAYDGALNLYERLLQLHPNDANVHSNLCMTLHGLGEDGKAKQHCQMAIRIAPNLPEPHNNLGNIYKDNKAPLDALKHYERAISLGSQNPLVYVNTAVVCIELLRFSEAEKYSNEALKRAPDFPDALNCSALALQGLGRYQDAIKVYEALLPKDPENIEYLNNLGTLWKDLGEYALAKSQFDAILKQQPDHVGARLNLALVHDLAGYKAEADKQYREILKRDESNSIALFNLGELLYEKGEQQEAMELVMQGLESKLNSARGRATFAKILSRQGSYKQAQQQIEKALELSPDVAFIWSAKGNVENELGNEEGAITAWEKAISLSPSELDTYSNFAAMYSQNGDVDAYRKIYQRAREALNDNPQLLLNWASSEERNNQLDEATALIEQIEEADYKNPILVRIKATLARRDKDYDKAYELLSQVKAEEFYVKEQRAFYFFELGSVQDKRGQYNEAFAAYKAANNLKNEYSGRSYDEIHDRERQQKLREFFVKKLPVLREKFSVPEPDGAQPIFIVGFPRSGTSLLEQILGSHCKISPAGELSFITDLSRRGEAQKIIGSELPYPECMFDPDAPLDMGKLEAMRDYYLNKVKEMGVVSEDSLWVTDKMPHNALQVGLISLLFPKSPIIHIMRHPLNPCLSAYFSNFNLGHNYTESLESTAKHYHNFMETLNYYKANLPMNFKEIHYEELVDDQERVVRELLEFIGVEWDENCLQHHKSKRLVKTASYEQVTQKVYRGSLERYRNYWDAVQPIIPILDETMKAFGYTAEKE